MKRGMTLIEVLLVMSILLLMIGIMTGALNPMALINKGKDARRKNDINRIKIAMEDYMTDKDCFPTGSFLTELKSEERCGSDVFAPWLNSWSCDPNGQPYHLFVEDVECPSWFKVIVYLENEKDRDIPDWWYDNLPGSYYVGDGSLSNSDVNFGTSSTNVLWYERVFDPGCLIFEQCHERSPGEEEEEGPCEPARVEGGDDGASCNGDNCYLDGSCLSVCKVSCCQDGQPCD